MKYSVQICRTERSYVIVEEEASSASEARRTARRKANDGEYEFTDREYTGVRVVDVIPIQQETSCVTRLPSGMDILYSPASNSVLSGRLVLQGSGDSVHVEFITTAGTRFKIDGVEFGSWDGRETEVHVDLIER